MPNSPFSPAPYTRDLAQALRAGAPPREIARIVRGTEPTRDPVPFRMISEPVSARDITSDPRYADKPILFGTHSSSNTQDMHGTWWSERALQGMRDTAASGLTMWLNHDYEVPESILGAAVDAQLVERVVKHPLQRKNEPTLDRHTDLDIWTLIVPEDVNPRAMRSYRAVASGVQLGHSVGVYILDWQWQDPDGNYLADVEEDWCGPLPYEGEEPDARLVIMDTMMIESSLVGIPSNRRGWAHEAARALRGAGVLPSAGAERVIRKSQRIYSIPRGEALATVIEQGKRALAFYVGSGESYFDLPPAARDLVARRVIETVKSTKPLDDPGFTVSEAVVYDQAGRIKAIAARGCNSEDTQHMEYTPEHQAALDAVLEKRHGVDVPPPTPIAAQTEETPDVTPQTPAADAGATPTDEPHTEPDAPPVDAGDTGDPIADAAPDDGAGTEEPADSSVPDVGGDGPGLESNGTDGAQPAPLSTETDAGARSLDDLDAAFEHAHSNRPQPAARKGFRELISDEDRALLDQTDGDPAPVAAGTPSVVDEIAALEAQIAGLRASRIHEEPTATATPGPAPRAKTHCDTTVRVGIEVDQRGLDRISAETAALRTLLDEATATIRALTQNAAAFGAALERAEGLGLYRPTTSAGVIPTGRAAATIAEDLSEADLVQMSDDEIIAHYRTRRGY